jgi:hypothetical protein
MTDEPQNVPDISADGNASPSVNPEMAQRAMELFGKLDEVMEDLKVPDNDRQQVMQNLMEAIAADLMTRLGTRMSDEEKQQLASMAEVSDPKNPNLEGVTAFFRSKFSQEELMDELAQATQGVVEEFIQEMGRVA